MPRCPNGTRKNKKTGQCVSTKSPGKSMKSRSPSSMKSCRFTPFLI